MAAAPEGYDADFLSLAVGMPRPLGDRELRELAYLHFSVLLDARRRLAAVTAVNIDGASLLDLERTGDWELDPRVPATDQAGPGLYSDNDLDRGHLVRRRDPGWGTIPEARAATEATFVYPNAAPQASVFNQSKELWLGLEDHVLHFAGSSALRLSVFTAPVLDPDDPSYRGVLIPRRFWKVAAWTEGSAEEPVLAAAGFVLDQAELIELDEAAIAVARLGSFRTFQVPISDIEAIAAVDLGELVAADVMPVAAARPGRWSELESVTDIRL
ncbi:MAG TPA: DNA/RNA non-specific endonuclease [Microbacterium sp.]|nr:DNA/RNA non-specific endonuclease [Microbacterium sp.]HEX5730736.1 DNA/RNA non-specific endonuclease [Microbacterium sp.]